MKILYVLIGVMVILLFVSGPGYESRRIIQYSWDTGHLFLFAAVVYAWLSSRKAKTEKSLKTVLIIIAISFVVGFSIEVIQLFTDRDFELVDVFRDVLGAVSGYVVFRIIQSNKPLLQQKLNIVVLLLLLFSGFYQLLGVIIDEMMMREDFPVLADFESGIQLSRWDTNQTRVSLSKQYVRQGDYSLKAVFLPDEYPDITLQHFPHDWHGYRHIGFSLYNPAENGPVTIELKIYDKQHIKNGYPYKDRFNHEFILHSGWNDMVFSLDKIAHAPEGRVMDMRQVKSFSLFLSNVKNPVTLFIDNLRLF